MPKVRRGRASRKARAATRGEVKATKRHFSGQHAAREEKRAERAEEKRELNRLKEVARDDYSNKKLAQEPHSMVIHRGQVGRYLRRLEMDIRTVMEPNTALKMKVQKRNNLKDFVVNGAPLGVTHLLVLTRSEQSVTLRIIRTPQGPTLTFRVASYTLAKHVVSALKKPVHYQKQFTQPPLIIMSGFTSNEENHLKLVQTTFQSMFPAINVDTLKLSNIRRCFIINYNRETETFDLRHYAIKAVPTGVSKSAKKLLQSKIPDLSRYEDISEFFLKPEQLSESEFEGDQKEVELPQDLTARGCKKGQTTSIRLVELGPRLTLSLVKIVEGIDDGEVLYHSYMKKTPKELAGLRGKLSKKRKLKERKSKDEEHRIIRKLSRIAERKKEEEEAENREKERLINKQKAVTGDYENEETVPAKPDISGKRNFENSEEGTKEDEPSKKRSKLEAERKNRQSDGLTRTQRREQKVAAAAAIRSKGSLKTKKPKA